MAQRGFVTLAACSWLAFAAGCPNAPAPSVALLRSNTFTQYGYDRRNSQNNTSETHINHGNVGQLHELWRLRVQDGATSVPVVMDGHAYFGSS
jgi:hypothetical protein